jgi:LysR family carnitine catabolism transcriptional activator
MDARQLEYVVAVVDHGTFSAAAAGLRVAQPSLSQGIRSLEAELGVELFTRTGRSVVLSEAGRALVDPARQVLADLAVARAAVDDVAGLVAGHLDIVCLPTLAVSPTATLVGRLRSQHPQLSVRVHEPDATDDLLHRVRAGMSEIGLTELSRAELPGLVATPLEQHDYVAVFSPGALAARREWVGLASLAAQPLITTPVGTSTRSVVDDAFEAGGLAPTIAVETEHREVIVPLVLAGAGYSILPRPLAARAEADGASVLELRPGLRRQVGMVHRTGPLSPAARAFVAIAAPDSPNPAARPRPRRR